MRYQLVIASLLGIILIIPAAVVAQDDAYRQKMDDAQDAKDDLMDAIDHKSGPKAVEATAKMTKIVLEAKQFWAAKNMADIVKLADASLAALDEMNKLAASGKIDQSKAAFQKIGDTCSACHDAHPEKRVAGK